MQEILGQLTSPRPDVQLQWQLTSVRIEEWLSHDVFHFKWWFLLAFFVASIIVWWIVVDKARLLEICLFGALVVIFVLALDEIGEELCMWVYPVDLIPIFPPLTSVDLATLPIIYALIYQRFGTWKSYLAASTVMAAVFCFVLEPLIEWSGFYQTLTWKYYYGFPIYIVIGLGIRLAVQKTFSYPEKAR